MKISGLPSKKVNFSGVNVVMVSKNVFKNPKNYTSVNKTFDKAANKMTGNLPPLLLEILYPLGLHKKFSKVLTFLETPFYPQIAKYCEQNKIPDLYWTGIKFDLSLDKIAKSNTYSFFVLTKNDKNSLGNLLDVSKKKISDINMKNQRAYNLKDCILSHFDSDIMNRMEPVKQRFLIVDDFPRRLSNIMKQIDY